MMQNIIVTRRWPGAVEQELRALVADQAEVTFNENDEPFSREEMAQALTRADIVCPTVTDQLDAEMFRQSDLRTRLLANFGVGYNHIDMAAAHAAGVAVTNTPGVLTDATAEIALTLLLSCARRTGEGERLVRAGQWRGWHPTHMLSTQVTGKTLGIVGMGRIGQALAQKAHFGLGMHIIYHSRSELGAPLTESLGATRVGLTELLTRSDFVSLHCPSTADTRNLIDAQALAEMPAHAFLINTARGDVVDEGALVEALSQRRIAGAGLDVYAAEPQLAAGLVDLENVVLLPHMGSGTTETRVAMGRCAIANVQAFLQGSPLPDEIRA
ncbi:MAG: D-glycerate dehydrogenase [Pseudomonadales bacterium]